jgi:hypothetical protein
MKITIEETTTYEVELDPAALIVAFQEEFNDFSEGGDGIEEFVSEFFHEAGVEEFIGYPGDNVPWVISATKDYGIFLSIHREKTACAD